jgi:exopolyphosphatase/guanosine-5'-triphosphate,3'-diphosphate pyrophosphatase
VITGRVAAIDCGTNSIRLLVADVTSTPHGLSLVDVHRELRIVRLGERVDETRMLQAAAIDRVWAALADYVAIIRASGATRVRMAATSATRDAGNSADFIEMVVRTLGQAPEIITGAEEAELSFRGAVGDLQSDDGPFLVADIGGGSTELVVGTIGHTGKAVLDGAVSVDIGSVRITERILHGDPPTVAEIDRAREVARRLLEDGLRQLRIDAVRSLVPVAGTATTIAAAALHLASYDPFQIHLAQIPPKALIEAGEFLLKATRAHRAVLPYMHPGRVDVIGGGAIILHELLSLLGDRTDLTSVIVSEHDILDGLAMSLVRAL